MRLLLVGRMMLSDDYLTNTMGANQNENETGDGG